MIKYGDTCIYTTTRHTEVAGQHDKLKKIWWYLDYLDKKFTYNFIPNENVTIDESMIKFKGRLSFRQYLHVPAKPTKWRVKAVEFGKATCTDSKFILVKKTDRKRAFHTEW